MASFPQLNDRSRPERSPVLSRGLRVAEGQEQDPRPSASSSLLCVYGVGQCDVERVIVLHEGRVLVMKHQFFQRAVQVIGLGKAVASGRFVDDTVLDFAVHHYGAGIAALFAALPDQEGAVSFPSE